MTIIDAHAHIYPEKIAEKATKSIGDFYDISTHAVGSVSALLESGAKVHVARYLVHSVAVSPKTVPAINTFVANECNLHPEFSGFMTLHPNMTKGELSEEIDRAIGLGLKGIKLHPDIQAFDIDCEQALNIYRAAGNRLPILMHTGDDRYDYSAPGRLAAVAKRFPKTLFIGAHFGGYSRWDELDCYLETPNVFFDTSSSLFKLDAEKAVAIIRKHGAERFFFGTDFPVETHERELAMFLNMKLTQKEKEMILSENILNAVLAHG